jgi:hypothetical protein
LYTNVLTDAKLFDALTEIDREVAGSTHADRWGHVTTLRLYDTND